MGADQLRQSCLFAQFEGQHQPADDTRLRSSNAAEPAVDVCDDCTESAFLYVDNRDVRILIV